MIYTFTSYLQNVRMVVYLIVVFKTCTVISYCFKRNYLEFLVILNYIETTLTLPLHR
jgi:hypothetical protein